MLDKAKRYLTKIQLKNKQRTVDKLYKKHGLTEEVLEKQVEINTLRSELDLPDASEFVYENFVQ